MRRATRMFTSMLIFMAKWHLFLSMTFNFEEEMVSVQNIIYRLAAEKFEYKTNSTQMRFVEWKPRMLRVKETQHENTSGWRGPNEGQNKMNISKTKISMQDFRDPLIGNHWSVTTCWQSTKRSFLISKNIFRCWYVFNLWHKFEQNYSQPYGLIIAFLNSLVLRPKSEYFVVDAAVVR